MFRLRQTQTLNCRAMPSSNTALHHLTRSYKVQNVSSPPLPPLDPPRHHLVHSDKFLCRSWSRHPESMGPATDAVSAHRLAGPTPQVSQLPSVRQAEPTVPPGIRMHNTHTHTHTTQQQTKKGTDREDGSCRDYRSGVSTSLVPNRIAPQRQWCPIHMGELVYHGDSGFSLVC